MLQQQQQQQQPGQRTLGSRVMFWMWMGTVVIGFAVMIAVIGSGH